MKGFSQSNFQPGYVITNEYDTIRGLIDFKTDQTNSTVCKFKKSLEDNETIYKPGTIAGYRFINERKYYVSRTVVVDSLQKTVFLEFLVNGLLNLYFLPGSDAGTYFIENQDGKMTSITKKPDEQINNGFVKSDNKYKGILSYTLKDDLDLALKTNKVEFNRGSLIECIKTYHDDMCKDGKECIIFENDYKKSFVEFAFDVHSGFEFNNIKFKGYNYPSMLSFSPLFGIGCNTTFPRVNKNFHLVFDASISKIAGAFDFINEYDNAYFVYNFSGIKSTYSGGIEYSFLSKTVRPVVFGSFIYSAYYNLKSNIRINSTDYTNNLLIYKTAPGVKTGAGIDINTTKKQFATVRISYSNSPTSHDLNETFQLQIGYRF